MSYNCACRSKNSCNPQLIPAFSFAHTPSLSLSHRLARALPSITPKNGQRSCAGTASLFMHYQLARSTMFQHDSITVEYSPQSYCTSPPGMPSEPTPYWTHPHRPHHVQPLAHLTFPVDPRDYLTFYPRDTLQGHSLCRKSHTSSM
jgi:hypothetical protein